MTVAERKAAAAADLTKLRQEQAVAVLEGKPFDVQSLIARRAEMEGLEAAEAEEVRRERANAAALSAHEKAETSGALTAYLAAVGRAESATRDMIAELKAVEALAEDMRRHVRALGGTIPVSIDANMTRTNHSAMLATELRQLGGHANYGGIRWNSMAPITDWPGHARKYVAEAMQPFLQGE